MQCASHPGFTAIGNCAACGRPMCDHCKVQMGSNAVCFQCKDRVTQGMQGGSQAMQSGGQFGGGQFGTAKYTQAPKKICPEARQALTFAIVGIFCAGFGFILGIVAIIKAMDAKKVIRRHDLGGEGLVTAAFVIGIIDVVLGSIGVLIVFGSVIAAVGSR